MQTSQEGEAKMVSSRVRRSASSAAIAAALMVYFGFVRLAEPTGDDLFSRAGLAFYHTLRIGGVAMAVIAAASLWGNRHVLIVDAVVSAVIGALFALTGIAMWIDGGGGLQSILNLAFGGMFISAGVRNWRDYFELASALEPYPPSAATPFGHAAPQPDETTQPQTPASSLAVQLRKRRAKETAIGAATPGQPPVATDTEGSWTDPDGSPDRETVVTPDDTVPPGELQEKDKSGPDGFLASFADDTPP